MSYVSKLWVRRYALSMGVAVAIGVATAAIVVANVWPSGHTRYVKYWPAFTMEFTLRRFDTGGNLAFDELVHLVVVDDFTWRSDVVTDRIAPSANGSYHELKNGVYSVYNSENRELTKRSVGKDVIVPVTDWLNPNLFRKIYDRVDPDWQRTNASFPIGNSSAMPNEAYVSYVGCDTPQGSAISPNDCAGWTRLEFAGESINRPALVNHALRAQVPMGAIAVFGQGFDHGKPVAEFVVQSLQIAGAATAATPSATGGKTGECKYGTPSVGGAPSHVACLLRP